MFYNRNAGDPTKWTYEPDEKRAINDGTWKNTSLRLTLQATARTTFNLFWDEQTIAHRPSRRRHADHVARSGGDHAMPLPLRTRQITWRSPLTSRVLLEGGYSVKRQPLGRTRARPRPTSAASSSTGNATRGPRMPASSSRPGGIPNLTYRSMNWNSNAAWSTPLARHRRRTSPARTA